jgi:hypothetical protein
VVDRPPAGRSQNAIAERVQRQEYEVVENRSGDQPDDHGERTAHRRLQQPAERVGDRGEGERVPGEMPGRRAVPQARANVTRDSHLVQWTPGTAGTIRRAG